MNPRNALATLLLALAVTACTTPPPPAPPAPEVFRPDGTLVVTNPRSTAGVDPCTLISPEEIRDIFSSTRAFSYPLVDDFFPVARHGCAFSGDDASISVYLDATPIGQPPPPDQVGRVGVRQSRPPTTLIAGNAAIIGTGDLQRCLLTVALDPRPATSSITLGSDSSVSCDELRGIAERIISRLPPAA